MHENYNNTVRFKDLRIGQTFLADDILYVKLAVQFRQDEYNARAVELRNFTTFKQNDLVSISRGFRS